MAFPSIRSSTSETAIADTTTSPTIPSSRVAGDLYLLAVKSTNTPDITSVTNFTEIEKSSVSQPRALYGRIVTNDANDQPTVNMSGTAGVSTVSIIVKDWAGTLADVETTTWTTGTNPASLTPTWGAADTLWFVVATAHGGTLPAVSAWSTNFTEVDQVTGDYTIDNVCGVAQRSVNATSQDPDSVTMSGSPGASHVLTVAVRPTSTVTVLYATADGTISSIVNELDNTTNLYQSVDDDPSSPTDSDFINNVGGAAGSVFFDLTDMASDFTAMSSVTGVFRWRGVSHSNDVTLYAQLFQSDESTSLSDEVQVTQATGDTAFANTGTVTFTGVNTSANKAVWDAAKVRLRWA